jgi:hypothetical protein
MKICICFLLVFSLMTTSCSTDQVLADLNLALQIAVQIIPAVTAISPSDGAAIQRVSTIATNALQVIEEDYKAFESSKSSGALAKLQADLDVVKGNLNAEIAALRIIDPANVVKVRNWANLIYSVTDAILSAVEGTGGATPSKKTMKMSLKPLPTPRMLKASWAMTVCDGEAACSALVR